MTHTPDRRRRRVAALLTLAQLGAALAIPAADAVLEARAAQESVHVEGSGTECATHHDDLFCQVVRSLSTQRAARGTPVVVAESMPALRVVEPAGAGAARSAKRVVGASGPRAPPIV